MQLLTKSCGRPSAVNLTAVIPIPIDAPTQEYISHRVRLNITLSLFNKKKEEKNNMDTLDH